MIQPFTTERGEVNEFIRFRKLDMDGGVGWELGDDFPE